MKTVLIKSLGVWLLFVLLAILNGAFRERLLVSYLGEQLALPISGLLLSGIIFLVTWAVFPFFGIGTSSPALRIGIFWLVLTIAFEFLFGHFITGDSWNKLFEAYNIWEGDLWVLVLVVILFSPYLAGKLRRVF